VDAVAVAVMAMVVLDTVVAVTAVAAIVIGRATYRHSESLVIERA